jgi:hypothetical protein
MDGTPAESVHGTATIRLRQPMAFSMYMKLTILMLPLAIVALLEARYQVSWINHGLDDVAVNQYWHYLCT